MVYRSTAVLLLVILMAASFTSCAALRSSADGDVERLLAAHDFFALRERLPRIPPGPERLVAEAAVLNAFNRPAESNEAIDRLLEEPDLTDRHRLEIFRIQRENYLRLQRYDYAYEAAVAVLQYTARSAEKRRDDQNVAAFLRALRDVPPQTVAISSDSEVRADSARRLPLRINGHERAFAVDTGANFSVLMRSEAVALGLPIRTAGFEVGTSTDVNMLADIAVADSVSIGNVHFENVVFLVFADRALTFPNGFEIRGLIGFPLIEAMREVHFRGDGSLRIPQWPTVDPIGNLALDGFDPLVQVRWRLSDLLCRFDSGANATVFYEPFYRRHRLIVERSGRPHRSQTGGVGGVREFDVIVLPEIDLRVGGRTVSLVEVNVHVDPLVAEETNFLDCNIGRDVLRQFGEYAINFESMSLVLQ